MCGQWVRAVYAFVVEDTHLHPRLDQEERVANGRYEGDVFGMMGTQAYA